MKPRNHWVEIRRADAETVTQGGLHIPDTVKKAMGIGKVVAVGPGRLAYEDEASGKRVGCSDLSEGDSIYFLEAATVEIEDAGTKRLFIREDGIISKG